MNKPKCCQKGPFVEKGEKKKYAWCSCGESANQPFCDGSHKCTGFSPIIAENEKERSIAWCGCKISGNPPFCDGSHSKL